jgi:predicted Fe-Mo cluster-binding NifX family protein
MGVSLMLAGGIGAGAINVLAAHGIDVVRGCSGNVDEVVNLYLNGELSDSGESCNHHSHHHGEHGHTCNH